MAEYDSARALAERLIRVKGRDITVRKVTDTLASGGTPNVNPRPWVPEADQEAEETVTVRAVILDAKRVFMDGTLVKMIDKTAYVAVQNTGEDDVVISKKDVVVDDNREYRIVELELLEPGQQEILYILGLAS